MKKLLLCLSFFIYCVNTQAQIKQYQPGQILHDLEKMKVLGSAMYIAAHPDDENTLLITWLANEKKVRTAYFAMTRGDGGQNLIGTEQGEYAGLLRTHELLGARSVDGGEQYFSRANDFGYSKTTEEALKLWNKDLVLGDLVYRIRKFRPDVLITRFPPDERAGHGHHSASSLLAELAFDAAADPKAFPEQLKEVDIWQAKRLFWNSYNRGFTNTPPDDDGIYLKYDIGTYNPLLGESYGEIGGRARSMHKSQGFGSALSRGERLEFLRLTKGEKPENDLFDGVNLTWSRLPGGQQVEILLNDIVRGFNPANPSASVPLLNQALTLLEGMGNDPLVQQKKNDLVQIILRAAGIYAEVNATDYAYNPGDSAKLKLSLLNRGNCEVKINNLQLPEIGENETYNEKLEKHILRQKEVEILIPQNFPITQPYWLQEPHALGNYTISNEKYRNLPMSPPALSGHIDLVIDGKSIAFTLPVNYKYVEPSKGEIYRYLEIRPAVMVTPQVESMLFANSDVQELVVSVKAGTSQVKGTVTPNISEGWMATPASLPYEIEEKGAEQVLTFKITAPKGASEAQMIISASFEGKNYQRGIHIIKYDHIPEITTFPVSEVRLVKPDFIVKGSRVAYVMGAGDKVPEALTQMGYEVTLLDEDNLSQNLNGFDAIMIGVRAYNTKDWLTNYTEKLNQYVFNGGTVICQYQTASRFGGFQKNIAPYALQISRDRVSEEDAEVRFIAPDDVLLNKPNKIAPKDFDGWVQERGLYFADEWAPEFKPVLSMNDTNETPKEGSLLHARYGSGNYIFTGLSFFRELPAGVPGAYRLLANLIAVK